jgi:hypothetical protein
MEIFGWERKNQFKSIEQNQNPTPRRKDTKKVKNKNFGLKIRRFSWSLGVFASELVWVCRFVRGSK